MEITFLAIAASIPFIALAGIVSCEIKHTDCAPQYSKAQDAAVGAAGLVSAAMARFARIK